MKDVFLSTGHSVPLSVTGAILLYSGVASTDSPVYATAHPVTIKGKRPVIGAGRPVDRGALFTALDSFAERCAAKAEFLPESVLAIDRTAVTWWCRPTTRRVFFDCPEFGTVTAVVPHPGLVFQARNTGFYVYAVDGAARPTPDTPLYEPPYFNTWDHGSICIGSARVPDRIDIASINGWECGFFESAFTHPNAGGKRVNHPRGEFAFWKEMLAGKYDEQFPLQCLVPMKRTLGDLIAQGPKG
ncbi:PRTRC system protein B [Paraburkholderia sp. BR14320]|uniref:PRTRC system protein B n=1 Tax=unclassified Paraburkholderia TaxID=2615204 RepID=UPI0034CDD430